MKKSKNYLFGTAIIALGAFGTFFLSCEKDEIVPNEFTPKAQYQELNTPERGENTESVIVAEELPDNCGKPVYRNMVTQGGIRVGKAEIYNDSKFFYIAIRSARSWYIGKSYAHIAYDMKRFPLDKFGNPDYQRFDYINENSKPKDEVYFKIPYKDIALKQFLNSVMCEVFTLPDRPGEKMHAWIQGRPYGETMEGKIFVYSTKTCQVIDDGYATDLADD